MADVVLGILSIPIAIFSIFWLRDRLNQVKNPSHYPLDYANAIITGDKEKAKEFERLWDTPARPITPTPAEDSAECTK